MKPRKKSIQQGINGAKYAGLKSKRPRHAAKNVFKEKVHGHYKKSPPRTKSPSPDNYTQMSRDRYIALYFELNQ